MRKLARNFRGAATAGVLAPLALAGCFSTPETGPAPLVAAPSAPIQRTELAPPAPRAPEPTVAATAPGTLPPPVAPGTPIDPVTGRPVDPLIGPAATAAGENPVPPVASEPLPAEPAPTQVAAAPAPPANVGRTDLLGRWTISSGGDKCDIYMSLTTWTGGYRASTRGCNSPSLAGISAWDLSGRTVTLKGGDGGASVASLSAADGQNFSGSTADGAGITFSR